MKFLYFSLLFWAFTSVAFSQTSKLQSGPMVGAVDMREAKIWVQTNEAAKVQVEYYKSSQPARKYMTEVAFTAKGTAFAATLIADSVDYGEEYQYDVYINGKKIDKKFSFKFKTPKFWQWREDPPEMRFVFGSCAFINDEKYDRPGKPYGGDYQIFQSIYEKKPDFMIWLGDNVYYRESDNTKDAMIYRQTQVRSLKELSPLLASCSHYAIWDDHDFGPNDSDRGFFNKETSRDVFGYFWANPTMGSRDEGIYTMFSYGDCDFFLLDNRYFRSPVCRQTGKREILGERQREWLYDNLAFSKAKFKFIAIGGQFLNTAQVYENHSVYSEERQEIIDFINQENIENVIFLTGDRHFSELSEMSRNGKFPLLDFTSSTFTAGVSVGPCTKETNHLRVNGTCEEQRNFGMVEILGTKDKREVVLSLYGSNGQKLWEKRYALDSYK